MINDKNVKIEIKRGELCDLLLSCIAAQQMANDGGEKWNRLHEKLKMQLDAIDQELMKEMED